LLTGEDGMGKGTIANVFANEMGVRFQKEDARRIQIQGDLTAILANLRRQQVLLISNFQSLKPVLAEKLLGALQDFKLEITLGQGSAAQQHLMELHPFTLIATCSKKADCPQEFINEFSLVLTSQPYTGPQLEAIAESIASRAGVSLEPGVAELIAQSCDRPGAVDVVFRRLARAIDSSVITQEDVSQAFLVFGINLRPDAATNGTGNLRNLSGQEFERLIAVLLSRMGFHAEMTKTSGDGGIDIIAMLDKPIFGGRYLFQCKRFTPDVLIGAPTVRDFYGAVRADNAVKGIFITTSNFTAQAREFGQRV
jgi:hypothetical protein